MNVVDQSKKLLQERVSLWNKNGSLDERLCVYTTGSFGRLDASNNSDLDVFLIALEDEITGEPKVSRLEEIQLLADIVHVNREPGLPDLDRDGAFLKVHLLSDYLVGLGKPDDDANNTFTGRLLLLLESKPIFGENTYDKVLADCVNRYWIDYADHQESFNPAFIINDILRFWRTLCVNYESGTAHDPEKRRAKNFKLKFSRLLTCFSAIVALHNHFLARGTISAEDALNFVKATPLERLEEVKQNSGNEVNKLINELFSKYEHFLVETDCSKKELYKKMGNAEYYTTSLEDARHFGDTMYKLFFEISKQHGRDLGSDRFLRYLTV